MKKSIFISFYILFNFVNLRVYAQQLKETLIHSVPCVTALTKDTSGNLIIYGSKSNLLIETDTGWLETIIDPSNTFYGDAGLATDKNNKIWIATSKGLISYHEGVKEFFNKSNSKIPFTDLGKIVATDDGVYMSYSSGQSAGVIYKEDQDFETIKTFSNIFLPFISSMAVNSNGEVMVSSHNYVAIIKGISFEQYDLRSELTFDNYVVRNIFADESNNFWISTSSGLVKYSSQTKSFEKINALDCETSVLTPKDEIFCFVKDNRELYVNNKLDDKKTFANLEQPNIEGMIYTKGKVHSFGLKVNGEGPDKCYAISTLEYLYDDNDKDGFSRDVDCNDDDFSINPAATDIVGNGIDEDCNGLDATTSTIEINDDKLMIAPNPSAGTINFGNIDNTNPLVVILDIFGREVYKIKLQGTSLNISILNNGTYIVKAFMQNGTYKQSKLVLVK